MNFMKLISDEACHIPTSALGWSPGLSLTREDLSELHLCPHISKFVPIETHMCHLSVTECQVERLDIHERNLSSVRVWSSDSSG